MSERKVGDAYKVLKKSWTWEVGSTVYLTDDDGTQNPWFSPVKGVDRSSSFPCTIDGKLQKIEEKKMTSIKEGDVVTIVDDSSRNSTGFAEGWITNGAFKGFTGYAGNVTHDYVSVFPTKEAALKDDLHADGGYYGRHNLKNVELKEKTMENLEVGDILKNSHGRDYDREVIAVFEELDVKYAVTADTDDRDVSLNRISHLQDDGWNVKNDEVKELTLEEVAKLAGIDVSNLRIKD